MKRTIALFLLYSVFCILASCNQRSIATRDLPSSQLPDEETDPYFPFIPSKVPVKVVRVAVHVFQNSSGNEFFKDQPADRAFIINTFEKLNGLLSNMPPLGPQSSQTITSPHISDTRIRVRVDGIYFHIDDHVHEVFSQDGIVRHGAAYAHKNYIIDNPYLDPILKHNTLHIIVAGTHPTTGGQVSGIGNKDFILFKGWYQAFSAGKPHADYPTVAHELGHSLGLQHHFGPHQCRQCQDLGCYPLGETNNIMALWPSTLESLSECQVGIIHRNLDGHRGNIKEVVIRTEP